MIIHAAFSFSFFIEFERVGFVRVVLFFVNTLVVTDNRCYDAGLSVNHAHNMVVSIYHVDVPFFIC